MLLGTARDLSSRKCGKRRRRVRRTLLGWDRNCSGRHNHRRRRLGGGRRGARVQWRQGRGRWNHRDLVCRHRRRGRLLVAENPTNATRHGRRRRSAVAALTGQLRRTDRDQNTIALSFHRVGMCCIEVEDDPGHGWGRAVLSRAHPLHAVGIYFNFGSIFATDRARKIQQDTIRIDCSLDRWLDRSTQGHFHLQVGPLPRVRHFAHRHRRGGSLRQSARHCEQKGSEMFGDCRHVCCALASAPPVSRVRLIIYSTYPATSQQQPTHKCT